MTTPPSAPPANGNIDVKPENLYGVSTQIAMEQGMLDKAATQFLKDLNGQANVGGAGSAVEAVNTAYRDVGEKVMQVWAKAVEGVGGAAVGFTVTANQYATADAASNPQHQGPAPTRPLPHVIWSAPSYGKVPNLKWNGVVDDGADGLLDDILNGVDKALEAILRPIVHHALRWGKAADILPLPDYQAIQKISDAWQNPVTALGQTDGTLTGQLGTITNQSNAEWYGAMRSFCSAVWGTAPWGKSREGYQWAHDTNQATSNHPALAVVIDTCDTVSSVLHDFAEAAYEMRKEVHRIYVKAVEEAIGKLKFDANILDDLKTLAKGALKTAKQLGMGITLHLDEGAINAAVSTYEGKLHALVPRLEAHKAPLDEAFRCMPKFEAEEARAEGFGARALVQFKHERKFTHPGDTAKGIYRIDLASDENLDGGHTLDKHVGKTDEQLAQRLRDQGDPPTQTWPYGKPKIGASSAFDDMEAAQRLTQYNIDQNSSGIKAWLDGPPPPQAGDKKDFAADAPNNEYSGRTVTKQPNAVNNSGYKTDGVNAQAIPTKGIKTVLKYDPNLDPPFVVLTSMPELNGKE
ncbi:RNase A-like domain-containing protein [Streptomyces orinoci]|uniref:RNase A-like domain-containing protein n=1 Tax=Streptomyces orinoci TaxID=67339 RepID=A0ABV3K1P9_STRON|nr:RNase A-like domain-containing protein [Streptomyces orinoci]